MSELDRRDFLKLVGVRRRRAPPRPRCSDLRREADPLRGAARGDHAGRARRLRLDLPRVPAGCGLHVRTREGRPIKLEGNPEHPINRGALCARGQASIGRTYHPDRFRGPQRAATSGTLAADRAGTRRRRARGEARAAPAASVRVLGGRDRAHALAR